MDWKVSQSMCRVHYTRTATSHSHIKSYLVGKRLCDVTVSSRRDITPKLYSKVIAEKSKGATVRGSFGYKLHIHWGKRFVLMTKLLGY